MCGLRSIARLTVASVALAMNGCGGGGAGERGNTPPPPPPAPATFTVGGTITGLTGTGILNAADVFGVVLQLNGREEMLVFRPDPTFAFSTALPDGASYAVTITAHPDQQVCGPEVVNGTGTINAANVTNLAITCADYSIGGTVTGLTASGLVLQLDDSGDLPVPPGSTSFTFPYPGLGNSALYWVGIKTQPAGQTCTIANAAGAVSASAPNVTSPAVTCVDTRIDTPPVSMFTIGGTVAGLHGSGLQLWLNDDAGPVLGAKLPSGSSTFAFANPLPTGTAYAVTVATQPRNPHEVCEIRNGTGTIGSSNITDVAVTCAAREAITASGTVVGLKTQGLSLRLKDINTFTGATAVVNLTVSANAEHFTFPETIPTFDVFSVGILTQPLGQTCTITRAKAPSLGIDITNLSVTCIDNATDPLSGTFSLLDSSGRRYFNFNTDGTFTTATIHNGVFDHSDPSQCNLGDDARDGNGVEYGVFSWTGATGAFRLPAPAAIDTNGSCGLSSPAGEPFSGSIIRIGDTIEIRETPGGPVLATATAVESDPQLLVGAFVSEINNGELLVFHADGTFLWTELQTNSLLPLEYGQERGCYSIDGSKVWVSIVASCKPDGLAAYDLNGYSGFFHTGLTTVGMPFTIIDAETIQLRGDVFKRTHPN